MNSHYQVIGDIQYSKLSLPIFRRVLEHGLYLLEKNSIFLGVTIGLFVVTSSNVFFSLSSMWIFLYTYYIYREESLKVDKYFVEVLFILDEISSSFDEEAIFYRHIYLWSVFESTRQIRVKKAKVFCLPSRFSFCFFFVLFFASKHFHFVTSFFSFFFHTLLRCFLQPRFFQFSFVLFSPHSFPANCESFPEV